MYVLERHISRYEALQPHAQLAGQHRGEKYYLRTALQPLHTADRWAPGLGFRLNPKPQTPEPC